MDVHHRHLESVLRRLCFLLVAFGVVTFCQPIALASPQSDLPASDSSKTSIPIRGDRLSGFVLPIEPLAAPITIKALRADAWTVDDTKRLLLSTDVVIRIGTHEFTTTQAVVWLNRIPSEQGLINQMAVYLENAGDPTAQAGHSAMGKQLLITASSRGEVTLDVALLAEREPKRTSFVQAAETRLADHLRRLAGGAPTLEQEPQVDQPRQKSEFTPVPGAPIRSHEAELPTKVTLPQPEQPTTWLAPPGSTVRYSAKEIVIARSQAENTVTMIGPLVVEFVATDRNEQWNQLTLTAERGVIFAEPGPLDSVTSQLDAKTVRGVYLEGNVRVMANNGEYMLRAPHMYYDFHTQKAIMLDSLLRVQPRNAGPPVFARAKEMRQLAQNQWRAGKVVVSTSEFHTPHIAIGSDTMTITQQAPTEENPDARTRTFIQSQGNSMQIEGVPVVPWPSFEGEAEDVPLRSIDVGTNSSDGVRILTGWDLFTVLGKDRPEGVDATLQVDGFTKRGAGGGLKFDYDVTGSKGLIDLYGLYDEGTDRTSSGQDVDPENKFRGVGLLEHTAQLKQDWMLQAQLSYISDETFITAWREDDFTTRSEYETSLYLKHQRDNAAFTILGKYSLQDFISNDYLLASRQYSVDKAPELTYRRYGDSLFGDTVTYSMENRVTRMSLAFQHTTPGEIGARPGAFGIPDDQLISDELSSRGLSEEWVNRVDTRHELSVPMQLGMFKVTPFVVGRFTGYDDDFEDFSSDTDDMRYFGAGGVRIRTQLNHVDDGVESRLFDLHRLRHLIEPYVTVWAADSSVEQEDLPTYDDEVESLADGEAIEFGMRNTWQTYRGGPGRWRTVDWFMIDVAAVLDSEGDPPESPTPQFFDYRPEYSQMGDHIRAASLWMLSDNLSFYGETTYALGPSDFARGSVGVELRHSPLLVTYIEYRHIEADDTDLLGIGWAYQMTPKYRVHISPQYDIREDDFRQFTARVTRSFPDFDLTFYVRYDKIRDDTSAGASIGVARF